ERARRYSQGKLLNQRSGCRSAIWWLEGFRHWSARARSRQSRVLHADAGNIFCVSLTQHKQQTTQQRKKTFMNNSKLDTFFRPIAFRLHANHMSRLGIANTMRLAYFYNRLKFGRQDDWRRSLYRTQLATLLEENGGLSRPSIDMKDGWALDTSMSLPHLDRVLEDGDKIIAERSGEQRSSKGAYRSY